MPNIHIRIPKGSYPGAARADLVRRINDAAANAEQIPAEPRKRMLCWVLIDEVAHGAWTCGGTDMTAQLTKIRGSGAQAVADDAQLLLKGL